MNEFFQNNILGKKSAIGVECVLLDENMFEFRVCEIIEKKKKLELKQTTTFSFNDADLKKTIKSETPINIVIQGRGVIFKKINASSEEDDSALLHKCIPGANSDEFYIQKHIIDEENIYIGIVRKSIINQLETFFNKNKILVVNITLGPFGGEDLFQFLKLESFIEQKINLGNYELTVSSNKIIALSHTENITKSDYNIDGVLIPSEYIYAFASAIGFYVSVSNKIVHDDFEDKETEYSELKTHEKLTRWILITIALVCVINFIIYKYYRSEFKDYYSQVQINQESLKSFENMKQQFEEKKEILNKNGLLQTSKISYYSDKIAGSLLNNIHLTKLESFPIKKINVDGVEDYIFQNEKIIVSGTCTQSIDFNSWERILKKMDWVKSVNIMHYMQEQSGALAKFTIEIELKEK